TPVTVKRKEERMETGLKKMGAMLGDFAETGCNAVLNPGTVIGRNATVYPLSRVRGTVEENCIYKGENNVVKKR
ncbi:MAG: UDP-N-acetylglucosamine pyrophosphorylase, partial [Candidatus Scatosoma sp.]